MGQFGCGVGLSLKIVGDADHDASRIASGGGGNHLLHVLGQLGADDVSGGEDHAARSANGQADAAFTQIKRN